MSYAETIDGYSCGYLASRRLEASVGRPDCAGDIRLAASNDTGEARYWRSISPISGVNTGFHTWSIFAVRHWDPLSCPISILCLIGKPGLSALVAGETAGYSVGSNDRYWTLRLATSYGNDTKPNHKRW